MTAKFAWLVGAGAMGLSVMMPLAQAQDAAVTQKNKPLMINRFYTGPDGQTHVEEIEAKFSAGEMGGYKLLANAGAELRRAPPGRVADWHTAPRRQYVITLSGHGELEVAGGKKTNVQAQFRTHAPKQSVSCPTRGFLIVTPAPFAARLTKTVIERLVG